MSLTQPPNLEVHSVPVICPLPFDPNRVLIAASRDVPAIMASKYIGLYCASYRVSRWKAAGERVSFNQF
jgi:hypothetical protein